jgi:GT2 family glycosyltransferase
MASDATETTLPVTAIIPAYKRPTETVRAIRSVKAQRPRLPAEIIVVDDGSEDGTAEAAEAEGDVRVIRHPVNQGLSAARNTAVDAARTPWIALLDSDDEWLPAHLDALWTARGSHVLVANSSLYVTKGSGNARFNGPVLKREVVLRDPARLVYPVNLITPSAVMVRRDAVLAAGGFRAYSGVVEDFGLWLRMLETGTGVVLPTVGMIYHQHEGQMSKDIERMYDGRAAAIAEHRGAPWLTDGLVERWQGAAAWDHLRVALDERHLGRSLGLAVRICSSPQRFAGVVGVLARRVMVRRRSAQRDPLGRPTVAVLPGVGAPSLSTLGADHASVDLRNRSVLVALAHLARRPTASALVANDLQRASMTVLGVRCLN